MKYRNVKEIEKEGRRQEEEKLPNGRKVKNTKKMGMKSLRRWFGDESEESDTTESDEDDWNEVDRMGKNREKIKKQKKLRKEKEMNTLKKARHIIGLGPITDKALEHHNKENKGDFEKAKKEATKEYLAYFLNYDDEELENITIAETSVAKKDDIMYIAFQNEDDIKEIYSRIATCGDPEIYTRNFIPPQIYERYMCINRICNDKRAENPQLKTQLRFGDKDIEIMVKERGSNEPYRYVKLEDFTDQDEIPLYDHTKKWRPRTDKPNKTTEGRRWRTLPKYMETNTRPGAAQMANGAEHSRGQDRYRKKSQEDPRRQDSTEHNLPAKKPRKENQEMDTKETEDRDMDRDETL